MRYAQSIRTHKPSLLRGRRWPLTRRGTLILLALIAIGGLAVKSYKVLHRVVILDGAPLMGAIEKIGVVGAEVDTDHHSDDESHALEYVGSSRAQRYGFVDVPCRTADSCVQLDMSGPITLGRLTVDSSESDTDGSGHRYGVHGLALWEGQRLVWTAALPRLRGALEAANKGPKDPGACPHARILMWHYAHFFTHLRYAIDDVTALANAFDMGPHGRLNAANREASARLYRLSRDLGWRKKDTAYFASLAPSRYHRGFGLDEVA